MQNCCCLPARARQGNTTAQRQDVGSQSCATLSGSLHHFTLSGCACGASSVVFGACATGPCCFFPSSGLVATQALHSAGLEAGIWGSFAVLVNSKSECVLEEKTYKTRPQALSYVIRCNMTILIRLVLSSLKKVQMRFLTQKQHSIFPSQKMSLALLFLFNVPYFLLKPVTLQGGK